MGEKTKKRGLVKQNRWPIKHRTQNSIDRSGYRFREFLTVVKNTRTRGGRERRQKGREDIEKEQEGTSIVRKTGRKGVGGEEAAHTNRKQRTCVRKKALG